MYESFYGLKCKPFALSPDPAFYYPSKEHNRVLAYLRYGINQGEGFIVVTGNVGAGKTTLIAALLAELASDKNIITAQLVTTQLQPDDLLKMVASSFGLRYENLSKSELLKQIENFLLKQAKAGKHVILIVDEAQNLEAHSLEELRMLSNFQHGTKSALQSFMLGQAEFKDIIHDPNLEQFRQRIIASYHLGPMAKTEVHNYIEHRLKVAGWRSDPHISKEAYDLIFQYTDAIPRRINMLMDRILLNAFVSEAHDITGDMVKEVVDELDDEIHFARHESSNSTSTGSGMANISSDFVERMTYLEKRVEALEKIIDKGRDLVQLLIGHKPQ